MQLEYSISLSDATTTENHQPATGEKFQHRFSHISSGRPPIENILEWIDSQIPSITTHALEMLKHSGTTSVYIHGRFPVREDIHGRCIHESLEDGIPYGKAAIDIFKHKLISLYERYGNEC